MNNEITGWFTTENGTHVPIRKGQSKVEAMDTLFGSGRNLDENSKSVGLTLSGYEPEKTIVDKRGTQQLQGFTQEMGKTYFRDKNNNIYSLLNKDKSRGKFEFHREKGEYVRKSPSAFKENIQNKYDSTVHAKRINGSGEGELMYGEMFKDIFGEKVGNELSEAVSATLSSGASQEFYEKGIEKTKDYLSSKKSDEIVKMSREFIPTGTKIYRANNSDHGISWTTDRATAEHYSKFANSEILEHTLTSRDRFIAPQFTEAFSSNMPQHEVLFDHHAKVQR